MLALLKVVILSLIPLSTTWDVLFVNVFAGGSHQTIAGYTANLLAQHGHVVTYISTNVPKSLHPAIKVVTLTENEKVGNKILNDVVDDPDGSLMKALPKIKAMLTMCGPFFADPYVQELIKTSAKFDAVVSFCALYDSCAFALAHKLNIPARIVHIPAPATFPAHITNYGLPIYKSSVNHNGITYGSNEAVKASPWLRVKNILRSAGISVFEAVVQRFLIAPDIYPHVPDYPGYSAVYQSVSLVLINHHPLTDQPIPFGPGVLSLAGTLCKEYNPDDMTAELNEFIDSADEFIYISFGSHIKHLLDVEKEILIGAFAKLPFNVVWKMKGTEVANLPRNVKTFSWLPQMSLLRHPKMKLFITHGGYASKIESFCGGVPMLVIPRMAPDQYLNAKEITERGLGDSVMSLRDSTSEEVYEKVMKVAGPEVLVKNKAMQRQLLATRLTDQQVLGYIDMAISGHKMLPGYQPFWEYFYLDIILIPVAAVYLVKFLVQKLRG